MRAYLSHLRSLATKTAALTFEYTNHSDNTAQKAPSRDSKIKEMWEQLSIDLQKVIGVEITPWSELARSSKLIRSYRPALGDSNQTDPLRITMSALKKKADKARLKDPTITLLKSWGS